MVPAGNKAKRLSSVNHTTKTIHHHHHQACKTLVKTLDQDRLANFTTDTNRTPSINNYLINKIKVTSFYNTMRRAVDALSKHRCTNEFTNTNLRRDLATLLINLFDGTLALPETVLHTYLDHITGKSALFFLFVCVLSGFSFTNIHESQDCRGRGRAFH